MGASYGIGSLVETFESAAWTARAAPAPVSSMKTRYRCTPGEDEHSHIMLPLLRGKSASGNSLV